MRGGQAAPGSRWRSVRAAQGHSAGRPDVAVWSFSSQQATLRRLNRAFDGSRRFKAHARPGYPRFKGKARFDSVEWPKDGDGARWHP